MFRVTRRYGFSASHRLHSSELSEDENRSLYGKCNNPYGHGHDYILDVTVSGAPDESGQLAHRESLDGLIAQRILARFDHRDLNRDIAELSDAVPTTENLAAAIQSILAKDWPLRARLDHVRIAETDRNIFELSHS